MKVIAESLPKSQNGKRIPDLAHHMYQCPRRIPGLAHHTSAQEEEVGEEAANDAESKGVWEESPCQQEFKVWARVSSGKV